MTSHAIYDQWAAVVSRQRLVLRRWRHDPALVADSIDQVRRRIHLDKDDQVHVSDQTIRALLVRWRHDPDAAAVLLCSLAACVPWSKAIRYDPDDLVHHLTVVCCQVDPTQTGLCRRIADRTKSRCRGARRKERYRSDHVSPVDQRFLAGEPAYVASASRFDLPGDRTSLTSPTLPYGPPRQPDPAEQATDRVVLSSLADALDRAVASGQVRPTDWQRYIDGRVAGRLDPVLRGGQGTYTPASGAQRMQAMRAAPRLAPVLQAVLVA